MATTAKRPKVVHIQAESSHTKWIVGIVATAVVALASATPALYLKSELGSAEAKYTKELDELKAQQGVQRLEIENALLKNQAVQYEKTSTELAGIKKDINAGFSELGRSVTDVAARLKYVEGKIK